MTKLTPTSKYLPLNSVTNLRNAALFAEAKGYQQKQPNQDGAQGIARPSKSTVFATDCSGRSKTGATAKVSLMPMFMPWRTHPGAAWDRTFTSNFTCQRIAKDSLINTKKDSMT
jgi:hypothetical protein